MNPVSSTRDRSSASNRGGNAVWPLTKFVIAKLSGAVVSLVLVLISAFFIFRVMGGDPVTALTRDSPATPEQKDALRAQLGLDKPLSVQFIDYITGIAHGDLGTSYQSRQPVADMISHRLPATLLLTVTALVLAATAGLWIGARAGWRPGSRFDRIHVATSLTLWSAPTFWLGLIVVMVFGRFLGLFPINGMRSPRAGHGFWPELLDIGHHLALPAITMAAVIYAQYVLVMRSSILDEKGSDYLTTARAKGLRDDHVRTRHAIPNALLPAITLVFMQLGGVVSGAILTETVFSWPGLGQLAYQALKVPDIPLLQGTFVVFSAAVIVANTAADLIYRFCDPRVRTS